MRGLHVMPVARGRCCGSLGCDVMTRSRAYVAASVLCVLHAALVSYAAWLPVGPNTGTFNRSFYFGIWPMLVISWPLWLIVLFILWRRGERERWQLLVPAAVTDFE